MMLIVGLQSSFACFLAQNASQTDYYRLKKEENVRDAGPVSYFFENMMRQDAVNSDSTKRKGLVAIKRD